MQSGAGGGEDYGVISSRESPRCRASTANATVPNEKMAPIHFPFIQEPLVMKDSDPVNGNGYLLGEERYLYVKDPQEAYARRIEQMSWIGQFGYWRD